jgi:hypothetical protein
MPPFGIYAFSAWRIKMDLLLPDRTENHLHGAGSVIAPSSRLDFGHATSTRRKHGRMPREESFRSEGLIILPSGIQHHLDSVFDVSIGRLQGADVHAEPPGIDDLTCSASSFSPSISLLLRTSADERLQHGLLAQVEAQDFHVPGQFALTMANRGEGFLQ